LFLSTYLLTATELNELFKLPILVEHFMEHNEGKKQISFWGFLCMHYLNTTFKYADNEDDMKLPFKSQSNFELTNSINSICFEFNLNVNHLIPFVENNYIISTEKFNIISTVNSIWQPPKFS
jgi:hypothetical protein